MTEHDPRVYLQHMRDAARLATSFAAGRSRRDLDSNPMLVAALARQLEIVGESASRVPESVRGTAPTIPWRAVVGMRNRLIHAYALVDLDLLWDTVERSLPGLLSQLDVMIDRRPLRARLAAGLRSAAAFLSTRYHPLCPYGGAEGAW